ncbi:endospore germination permease [Clostridium sp. WLY-B-L2]|uniref:Endospore germination permease n=1 Tax=Clostridium aromativorans TaxID=2836848 RepID=A0ABS8N4I0_9CLOT|nr:endospore germination permease [Clostridium aromativorans]MCC9294089.1 endospore germination permease [Clostridium aromativorans]
MGKFSFKHIFFIVPALSISSLKTYPQIFMNMSGRDSWVAIIITCMIMLIYFDYLINICLKNNCYSLHEIFTTSFGNLFGNLLLIVFASAVFLSLIESASVEANVVHTNFFIESPVWYILLFVVIPGFYTVKRGRYSVMAVIMVCIAISVFNGINLAILTSRFKDYGRLFPIFEHGINADFFLSIVKSIGMYSSIVIALPYLSQLDIKKGLRTYSFLGNLFVAQMIIVAVVGVLATFNVERANTIVYPKLVQTQLISYFGFIASGEFYVIFQVISGWFSKYVTTFFALVLIFREFKINKVVNPNIFLIVFTVVIYVVSYMTSKNLLTLFSFLNLYVYVCVAALFLLPLVAFTVFNLKSSGK